MLSCQGVIKNLSKPKEIACSATEKGEISLCGYEFGKKISKPFSLQRRLAFSSGKDWDLIST